MSLVRKMNDAYRTWKHRRAIYRQVRDTQLTTGVDRETATRIVTDQLVEKTLESMVATGFNNRSMYQVIAYKSGDAAGNELDHTERVFADSFAGELACFRGIAKAGFLTVRMLGRYAWTGDQKHGIEFDPLLGCVKETYRGGELRPIDIYQEKLRKYLSECGAKEFRQFSPEAWHRAICDSAFFREHPEAANLWFTVLMDSLDANRLRVLESLTDPTHRNVVASSKREAIEEFLDELHKEKARR